MSFFRRYLSESLKDSEFKREWDESEAEYLATRDAITLERLARIETEPQSAIPWKDIKRT